MLIPADGVKAVKRFVIDKVIELGGRVCPPTIVGVGIGGTSDLCVHLAKRAATRPLRTTLRRCGRREDRGGAFGSRQRARHRPARPRRQVDGLRGACRAGGDAYHHEPRRGEHAVPFGAARHARRSRPAASRSADETALDCQCRRLVRGHPARMTSERSMTHHTLLASPIGEKEVRALKVGDTVTLRAHALRHSRRDADPHVRPRPAHSLRSAPATP